jgi:hypothetical protein
MRCALTSALLMRGYDQVLPTNGPKPWTTIGPAGAHSAWSTILNRTSEAGRTLCPLSKSLESATETVDCPPLKNAVKARTVEDALRAIGQAHARLGAPDPRKDSHGGIDFRIQRQIPSYKKVDLPPRRVKPIPIIIILYILAQAYDDHRSESDLAVTDMIVIACFFLLRPCEYTGTTNDDAPFRLEDVHLYIGGRKLNSHTASLAELDAASSVSYKFTTQKNGIRDEKLVQGRSGSGLCCPMKATVFRIKHHRLHKSKPNAPLASYYRTSRRTAIKPKDVTDVLRQAMTANFHRTGVHASEVSARSLRAGGTMAMLFGKIDINSVRMMGRWHSDAMM